MDMEGKFIAFKDTISKNPNNASLAETGLYDYII